MLAAAGMQGGAGVTARARTHPLSRACCTRARQLASLRSAAKLPTTRRLVRARVRPTLRRRSSATKPMHARGPPPRLERTAEKMTMSFSRPCMRTSPLAALSHSRSMAQDERCGHVRCSADRDGIRQAQACLIPCLGRQHKDSVWLY